MCVFVREGVYVCTCMLNACVPTCLRVPMFSIDSCVGDGCDSGVSRTILGNMITHGPCPFCPLYTQHISSHSAPEYQCEKSGSYYQTFSEKNVFILVAVSGIGDSCPILPYFST